MKFIVLADLHLPDRADTVKELVLDWIVDVIKLEQPDYLIGAGDRTASGTVPASVRLVQKLRSTGVPFLLTPGNAELRTPEAAEEVAAILKDADEKKTPFR
ncbi:MAG: metallophosphoesterase, partial [Lentisphaeria bacterium]|nr:metallophosphoesterase [Lentisphaeria bacterium]